jgi:hypothetical protein
MIMSWVETQDDWVVILSYEMWDIRSVNKVYVDNLGPTSIGETAEILVEILVEPVYKKKNSWKFPIYCEKERRKIRVVTELVTSPYGATILNPSMIPFVKSLAKTSTSANRPFCFQFWIFLLSFHR